MAFGGSERRHWLESPDDAIVTSAASIWECRLDRDLLEDLFRTAVAAADPARAIATHLPEPPRGRTVVVGAGKASAQMAAAFERLWPGPLTGLVVTRYGYAAPTRQIEI